MRQKENAIEMQRIQIHQLEEDLKRHQVKLKHKTRQLQSSSSFTALEDGRTLPTDVADELATLRDWKRMAQCSVCNFKVKDHVITRCMHVFCKDCIDMRLETRQRKCPQCGGMFGPGDVKTIYL
jgi:E3 ubiquitin-protein ligase BRE1